MVTLSDSVSIQPVRVLTSTTCPDGFAPSTTCRCGVSENSPERGSEPGASWVNGVPSTKTCSGQSQRGSRQIACVSCGNTGRLFTDVHVDGPADQPVQTSLPRISACH